jgi:hypothetical protein
MEGAKTDRVYPVDMARRGPQFVKQPQDAGEQVGNGDVSHLDRDTAAVAINCDERARISTL